MKKVLKVVGLILLLLVLSVAGLLVATFSGGGEIPGGKEFDGALVIQDGHVSGFMLESGPGRVVLIDALNDPEGKQILAALAQRKLGPDAVQAIFLTHGHFDHLAAVPLFKKAEVYAMKEDVPLAEGKVGPSGPIGQVMGPHKFAVKVTHPLEHTQTSSVGSLSVESFFIPGHTKGSAAYLINGVLFLGDSADGTNKGTMEGAKWIFSESQETNRQSLIALAATLKPRAAQIKWLAFAHTGVLPGFKPLEDFAARASEKR